MTATADASTPAGGGGSVRGGAARGVVASWIRLVVVTAIGFVQIPILFRHVPPAELGVWYLLFAVATFINLSDLGLPSTLARAVAYLWGKESSGRTPEPGTLPSTLSEQPFAALYGSGLGGTALIGLAVAAVAYPAALAYFVMALPSAPPAATLYLPLLLFLAGVVLNLVGAIPAVCLSGFGEVAWDNALRTGAHVLGFAALCVIVPVWGSLVSLCAIYLAQGALYLAATHLAVVRRLGRARVAGARPSWPLVVALYRESATVFVSRLGLWFTAESTLLVAGYFMGAARVAEFAVLRQVVSVGANVTTAIPIAVSPHASAAHAAGEGEKVKGLYEAALRFTAAPAILWFIGLLLWGPEIVRLLAGPGKFLGFAVLVPLAIANLLELHAVTHGFFVWAVGKWPFTPWLVGGGFLNLLLTAAGCAGWGFPGLAWGAFASQLVTANWIQVFHGLRTIGLSAEHYVARVLRPALLFGLGVSVAGVAVKWAALRAAPLLSAGGDASILTAAVGIVLTSAIAGAIAWAFVLGNDDRAYLLRLVGVRR